MDGPSCTFAHLPVVFTCPCPARATFDLQQVSRRRPCRPARSQHDLTPSLGQPVAVPFSPAEEHSPRYCRPSPVIASASFLDDPGQAIPAQPWRSSALSSAPPASACSNGSSGSRHCLRMANSFALQTRGSCCAGHKRAASRSRVFHPRNKPDRGLPPSVKQRSGMGCSCRCVRNMTTIVFHLK